MFATVVVLIFILSSCIDLTNNTNEILKERTDYEGIKKGILFIKSGGGTVGDSYQFSIVPHQDKLKDGDTGNIFIADEHDGDIRKDTTRVNFEWLNFDTLKVSFDKRLRVFKMITEIKDVKIIYDSLSLLK